MVLRASAPENRAKRRKIFDRELDNFHQEELGVQAVHLARALKTHLSPAGVERLRTSGVFFDCLQTASQLIAAVTAAERQTAAEAVATMNHWEVFVPIALAAVAESVLHVGEQNSSSARVVCSSVHPWLSLAKL